MNPSVLLASLLSLTALSSTPVLAQVNVTPSKYDSDTNSIQLAQSGSNVYLCEVGTKQSPIDINNPQIAVDLIKDLRFNYQPSPLSVVDDGTAIKVNYQPGSTLKIQNQTYQLLQFHFHTPSEHEINGTAAALEMHLVHSNSQGELAVVGVLIKPGQFNPVIAQILSSIGQPSSSTINAADLLPSGKNHFSYSGSLTTPPCSEGVKWYVLEKSIEVSADQIATFQSFYPDNARPVQPLNGRKVEFHKPLLPLLPLGL